MVQKIHNLDTEVSNDQIEIEWSHLLSTRNKLLEISDWTQLSDVFLTPECKKEWGIWRNKLRKVTRTKFPDFDQAKSAIEFLKREMPKSTTINDLDFQEKYVDAEITHDKIIEKTIIREQPIVIQEKITNQSFLELLKETLESDAYAFKDYLNSFLDRSNTNLFLSTDHINDFKVKAKAYVLEQHKYTLAKKLKGVPDYRLIQQRAEEALEYLSIKNPVLDEFPLLKLNAEVNEITPEEAALNCLKQRKWYNQLLLESDKFLSYTTKLIEDATEKTRIQSIVESIKNGY